MMEIVINPKGQIRCLYDEAIPLTNLGSLLIQRASHVEPNALGQWHADLSPVNGPTLGPFARRSEALSAERVWLETHILTTADIR